MNAKTLRSSKRGMLILEDNSTFEGISFGYPKSMAGEVVFNTGMVGYTETLSDPSYSGQILTFTYPLIGNYGIPNSQSRKNNLSDLFESNRVQVQGLIVSDYCHQFSHWQAKKSLSEWLVEEKIPALYGIDTRSLTRKLREKGTMLGKIIFDDEPLEFFDPNKINLMSKVSIKEKEEYGKSKIRIALIDCGSKHSIIHNLLKRNFSVLRVPWDYDLISENFDGLFISNGPGNPEMCEVTIKNIVKIIDREIPIFGVCLGHQLLSLAAGAKTFKLKYGHRSQNQPVLEEGTSRCLITSQNHGYAVDVQSLSDEWEPWFTNLNDGTNEGIRHRSGKFMSVQFHPEASPGPLDASYLFDHFVKMVKGEGVCNRK